MITQLGPSQSFRVCILEDYIISMECENDINTTHLTKFDSNLNLTGYSKYLKISQVISITSNKNFVYMLAKVPNLNINVFNDKLEIIRTFGQTKHLHLAFYLSVKIYKSLIHNENIVAAATSLIDF